MRARARAFIYLFVRPGDEARSAKLSLSNYIYVYECAARIRTMQAYLLRARTDMKPEISAGRWRRPRRGQMNQRDEILEAELEMTYNGV